MRIKRFIAPDMRTALRMVRDEQGPDAVILSNRPTDDGIEIVAATDYDESLAQQALRAALPALAPTPAPVASPTTPAIAAAIVPVASPRNEAPAQVPSFAMDAPPSRMASLASLIAPRSAAKAAPAPAVAAPAPAPAMAAVAGEAPARRIAESPIRGRAVFAIGEAPADAPAATAMAASPARAPKTETRVAAAMPPPDTSRFDAMMAALIPQGEKVGATVAALSQAALADTAASIDAAAQEATSDAAPSLSANAAAIEDVPVPEYRSLADLWNDDALRPSPDGRRIEGEGRNQDHGSDAAAAGDSASCVDLLTNPSVAPHPNPTPAPSRSDRAFEGARTSGSQAAPSHPEGKGAEAATTHLQAVPDPRDASFIAMRDEMATMRALIERELGQLNAERLRGSPARAAAYDALMGYGCDESLAQTVAGRIDARLDPSQIREPMLAELSRMLSVVRHEPIDDGGVIALVGPTGAGKTTTAAKLAARFAQRHRARDVALVTTDTERPGATEQLHILGRRLGITVCEANGPEALNEALDQLADYPLVLVDTAGHGLRDRALLGQILWLRAAKRVRSLLVLPANSNAHDLGEVVRRYRPASPEGVVLTKLDETGRLGTSLSVLVQHGLSLAYTTDGQQIPHDLATADATRLVATLEKVRRAADNPLGSLDSRSVTLPTEDRHAIAS